MEGEGWDDLRVLFCFVCLDDLVLVAKLDIKCRTRGGGGGMGWSYRDRVGVYSDFRGLGGE